MRPETEDLLAGIETHHPPMLTDISSTKIRDASVEEVGQARGRGVEPGVHSARYGLTAVYMHDSFDSIDCRPLAYPLRVLSVMTR